MTDHDHMQRALLPCPFCGGEPKLRYIGNDRLSVRKLEIKCSSCRMQLAHATRSLGFDWLEGLILRDWNRRDAAALRSQGAQAVPEGWSGWATQYGSRLPKLWGARELAELNFYPTEDARLIFLVECAAPKPEVR